MTDKSSQNEDKDVEAQKVAPKKKPWVKPVLKVLRAGSAENSTRINGRDGGSGFAHKLS